MVESIDSNIIIYQMERDRKRKHHRSSSSSSSSSDDSRRRRKHARKSRSRSREDARSSDRGYIGKQVADMAHQPTRGGMMSGGTERAAGGTTIGIQIGDWEGISTH
ncbi:hypothetical protein FGO68_gene11710 [Halteria grandinella]|uniref:Uncharacterized protein n=1 Tax=Halteria grandinella TaxID=5974 RepID=A0A8J8T8H8_HALGN|nr:hypothetical protein FGO68_gene11710 [Halteria grandinella]